MQIVWSKMFEPLTAFHHPVTRWTLIGVAVALVAAPAVIEILTALKMMSRESRREVYLKYLAWLVLIPLLVIPILLGPGVTILAVGVLSLLCYREFARATGFFRNRAISAVVVVGILALVFAEFDHWYNMFVAGPSLAIAAITIVALARDDPHGYIQRVAMGVLAFVLFGVCLGHLAYIANDRDYRPIILLILLCVEANDVFAFICGRAFGRIRIAPNTSPNKTLAGVLGALMLTTTLFAIVGHFVFEGSVLDKPKHLITMGALLSIVGQYGDLVMSSIKRDLGIKDMGVVIPGHGGLLDRFDSLILVSPAIFHYVGYFRGFGLDQPTRILFND